MGEDTPEVRHVEHKMMTRGLDALIKRMEEQAAALTDFIVKQSDANADFRVKFLDEIRAVERSIASKCENDSAMMTVQNREVTRLDRVEIAHEETAKALAVVATAMGNLECSTKKDLGAAHDEIRGHGVRIQNLERRGGKLAIRFILYLGAVIGTISTALLIAFFTGILKL